MWNMFGFSNFKVDPVFFPLQRFAFPAETGANHMFKNPEWGCADRGPRSKPAGPGLFWTAVLLSGRPAPLGRLVGGR